MKFFSMLGCLPSRNYPAERDPLFQCIKSPKLMPQRKDPSSSYIEHISPRSISKGQQWPPLAAEQTISTSLNDYQPQGLQEDIEWAIYVALNELGGVQRNCEYLTSQLGKEDSESLLDVNHHLEVLKKSKCSDLEVLEHKSPIIEIEIQLDPKPKARKIVREKLEAILTKKLDFTIEAKSNQMKREEGMWLLCTLFLEKYEFDKGTLIQLWTARGFIKNDDYKKLIGDAYFNALVEERCIECSRTCFSTGERIYKVNGVHIKSSTTTDTPMYLRLSTSDFEKNDIPKKLENLSLWCIEVNQPIFNQIEKLEDLRALLLFQLETIEDFQQPSKSSTSKIYKIPPSIFLNLKQLQVLSLSGFPIVDLPSSIGEAKELRYIDLSYSSIELLPEKISLLKNLQTLKLKGCVRLVRLPDGIIKLASLVHLDLNILSQLTSLPKSMGKLTTLETLSAFLVDKDYGRRINELSNMNNLKGSLCIAQLERVSCENEAKEAALKDKEHLKRLELRWSAPRSSRSKDQELEYQVLDNLCPPSSIEDLEIIGYGGLKFPNWIGDSKVLHILVSITLIKCEHPKLLPSLGELPLLQTIDLIDIKRVYKMGSKFRGSNAIAFPKLKKLTITGMSNLETWNGVKEGDFPVLSQVIIENCPKLTAVPSFSCFHSLKQLEISQCTKLSCWSQVEFPSSLNMLVVENCPSFKKRYYNPNNKDRTKIMQVSNVWIDHEEITKFNNVAIQAL